MAINNINGIPWSNLATISGVSKSVIANVNNVTTPSSVTCTPTVFGYSDGRRNPPESACTNIPVIWDYDAVNGALYISGQCGVIYAPTGFYAGEGTLYFYDGANSFMPVDSCPR